MTFRVKLQNTLNGRMDIDYTTGLPRTTSIARTLYVQNSNLERLILKDGDEFDAVDEDDEAYWMQFVYVPGSEIVTQSLENAFLEVVS